MRRSVLLGPAVLTALLSACGTYSTASGPPADSSVAGDGPVVVAEGEVLVSCGSNGAGWPSSVMPEGVQGVLSDDEARRIFQGILDDPMSGEEAALSLFPHGVVDVDWRVLREDDNSLAVGLGGWTEQGPGEGAHILGLERDGDAWRTAGWGDCQLSPVLDDGNIWVEVTEYSGVPASARLTAQVDERECTSGRDPERFLHEPFVVETSEKVTIYWTSTPPKGGQDCQGNPSIDTALELEQPLVDRVVFDGSSYPPR